MSFAITSDDHERAANAEAQRRAARLAQALRDNLRRRKPGGASKDKPPVNPKGDG